MIREHNNKVQQLIDQKSEEIRELKKQLISDNNETKNTKSISYYNDASLLTFNQFQKFTSKQSPNTHIQTLIKQQNYATDKDNNNFLVRTKCKSDPKKIAKQYKIGTKSIMNCSKDFFNYQQFLTVHSNSNKVPANKINNNEIELAKNIIMELDMEPWEDKLNNVKQYILCNISNFQKLYHYYYYKCKNDSTEPISIHTIRNNFKTICSNIHIRYPNKDICHTCNIYRVQLQANKDIKIQCCNHCDETVYRREIYKQYKGLGINIFSFDFKQNIQLPNQLYQSSILFFKSKFYLNCFNIVDEINFFHNIYIYKENYAKTADEVNTMLLNFLKNKKLTNNIIMYSDNCCGQNKNRYLIALLHYIVEIGLVESIRLKFLLPGHSPLFTWCCIWMDIKRNKSFNFIYYWWSIELLQWSFKIN